MEDKILIEDPRMQPLLQPGAELRRLCTGAIWSEGPVWWEDGSVTWSDIPNNRMLRWSPGEGMTVFRSPSNHSNGHTRDRLGRMVSCEHSGRRVSLTEHDGTVVTLVDSFEGKRLNSPNDVVVKSDGTIWFTDPPYGIISDYEGVAAESEIGANHVYRFDPADNSLTVACNDFQRPNGLAFSPDETLLYVSDTSRSHDPDGNHHIRVFDIIDGRHPRNGRVFAVIEPGLSDGFRLDVSGNLFTSSADSIQVFAPDGTRLGKIFVPEVISNCTFGGANRSTLFITASTSLYAIDLATKGSVRP